jgi:glycosyltransferase involved in cell wall biosynthesis
MSSNRLARTLSLLHIVSGSEWRDRHRQALALSRGLVAKGHRSLLVTAADSALARQAARVGQEFATFSSGAIGRLFDLRRLRSGGAARWDVAHAHDPDALRRFVLAGRGLPPVPIVLTVRGDIGYGNRVLPRGTPVSRVDQFFASSEWVWSALVRSGIPEDRISVVHTAVDLEAFRPAPAGDDARRRREEARRGLGLPADAFVVGSVLHLTRGKGVEVLLEAAGRIRSGRTPPGEDSIRVVIVGEGPDREHLEREAARAGMGDAVTFTGPRDDVAELLAAMDVYVHPATSGDGFPVALREAMAMSVPVVSTDLMGIREIIDNGKHGLIVPGADPEALALNIMKLRRDPAQAQQLGKAGNLKVQRYGVQAMVDRAEELYFRLVR